MQLVYGIIPVLAAAQVAADRLLHAASAAKCWNTTRVTTNKGVTRDDPWFIIKQENRKTGEQENIKLGSV